MASILGSQTRAITLIFALLVCLLTEPTPATAAGGTPGLYESPVLVVDPGMHTAQIWRADVDSAGRAAVTGSDDKTIRIWSLKPPGLIRTIRVPSGPGDVGKIYAVAMSPDGELVAAGGWTRWTETDLQQQIYVLNRDGKLVKRIAALPNAAFHLDFSPDGRYLAAVMGGPSGLRIFDRDKNWNEIARDADYGDSSFCVTFARDGRLATTSWDGFVRLYSPGFNLIAKRKTFAGKQPYGIAFHPEGRQLALGFHAAASVEVLDAETLDLLSAPDTEGIDNGDLLSVAWSEDGNTLYAGGQFGVGGKKMVVAWSDGGSGNRRLLPAGEDILITIAPLPDGEVLIASQDPFLAVLGSDGARRWIRRSPSFDPRGQDRNLAVSADGSLVAFGYMYGGKERAHFDVRALRLSKNHPPDNLTTSSKQSGLKIENWIDSPRPTLDGAPIGLEQHERSQSLAVHPKGDRFVLGTEWALRAFDAEGESLWRRDVPSVVWAVNIAGDGRMVIAAYGDGTIRWHRMDDGRELLAFMPLVNRTDWVAWTPDGIYAATAGAHGVLQWHVNRGWDAPGEAVPVSEIPGLHRPKVLPLVIQEMDPIRALGLAEYAEIREAVRLRTRASVAPGAKLHVLTVGVGDYGEHAIHLKLEFADNDAIDVANALVNTQQLFYADVRLQHLTNENATHAGIIDALDFMRRDMARSVDGRDLAVVMFSGHGAIIDDQYYLFPYDVDARSPSRIRSSAIPVAQLRAELAKLGEKGRVLVLLDACRSGATTTLGARLDVDAKMLRAVLAATNVTVLTSSKAGEVSREHDEWKNGAFSEVLLEALGKADNDHNGLISITELTRYISTTLPRLTGGKQRPGIEIRFESDIFVSGL